MARCERRVARIHEEEGAGAVGVLDHTRLEAGLAEGGGLLIACHPGYGDGRTEESRLGRAEDMTARPHLGEQR